MTTSQDWISARGWVDSGQACEGAPILYRLTRSEVCDECPDCAAGVCVQREETCRAWESRVVIHAWQRATN